MTIDTGMVGDLAKEESTSRLDKALSFLEFLVNTNSQTRNVKGVNLIQDRVSNELEELNFNVQRIKNNEKRSGDLILGTFKGEAEKSITFICHADTVLGPTDDHSFLCDRENNKCYGPGIADDKAGIVVSLEGIGNYLKRNPNPYYTLKFVCSPNEEAGSLGLHHYFQEIGDKTEFAFGFEPSLVGGDIICSRNGNRWYKIQVKGKAAHAGRFDDPSLNAAHELSMMISDFHSLNDLEKKIKVNVGSISGGTGHYNVVCAEAMAKLDVRFSSFEDRDDLDQRIQKICKNLRLSCEKTGDKAVVQIEIEDDCPPLPENSNSGPLISEYLKFIKDTERRSVCALHTGGAADINYFIDGQNSGLDGLGGVGAGLHTRDEFIEISSLITRADALTSLLEGLPNR